MGAPGLCPPSLIGCDATVQCAAAVRRPSFELTVLLYGQLTSRHRTQAACYETCRLKKSRRSPPTLMQMAKVDVVTRAARNEVSRRRPQSAGEIARSLLLLLLLPPLLLLLLQLPLLLCSTPSVLFRSRRRLSCPLTSPVALARPKLSLSVCRWFSRRRSIFMNTVYL